MKYYLYAIFVFIQILFSQSDTVAVLPFSISGSADVKVAEATRDLVESILIQKNIYQVVERTRIDKIISEYKLQESGLTSTAIEIGKLLKVSKVITGKLIKLDLKYTIAIEEIEIKTGKKIFSERNSGELADSQLEQYLIEPLIQRIYFSKPKTSFTLNLRRIINYSSTRQFTTPNLSMVIYAGSRFIAEIEPIGKSNAPVFNKSFNISDYTDELIVLTVYDNGPIMGKKQVGQVIMKSPTTGIYPIEVDVNGQKNHVGECEIVIE